jgi:membrane-anchored glycerophosphoryl diester phosphodiesterase (GDPDase)
MAELGLRPLSLGEILDRTFSLYRRHFILFLGITGLPHLLILALNLGQVLLIKVPAVTKPPLAAQLQTRGGGGLMGLGIVGLLVGVVVYLVAYLFSQGGTIYAVSELYLGRTTTIGSSLRRVWGQLANLFGVSLLNGLAVMGAAILLIIPGIYVACRLITCVPAALLEDLGPRESLERSFRLTKNNAGRAFVIYFLYFVLLYAAAFLFMTPFGVVVAMYSKDPGMLLLSMGLLQVANFLAGILVGPFLLIATSIFYYDLRVRKEAFDLQLMMNPSGNVPAGNSTVPSMLS